METAATDDFLDSLTKSGLLSRSEIEAAKREHGLEAKPTAKDVADVLVNEGVLTLYQAGRLLDGNHRGLVIDGYKLLYMVGSGGMGFVYAAQEPDSPWKVAIKVLSEELEKDPGALSRFQLEAEAGMRLSHPNVVRTLAINKTENIYGTIHYVVMELIQGVSLVELLEIRRPISYQRASDIILQVAEGLHYAHQDGLVHRDMKPENLMIRSNGSAKVLDFGLALLDESGQEFAMSMIHGQNCVGTADFIAPEQSIDSYNVDQRADIYGLGCTFYAALTCKVPFPTKSVPEKLEAHRTKHPREIQKIRPDVPDRLAKIIRKMMAKKPEDRFQSCAEVAAYLKPFAKRKEVHFDFEKILAKRAKRAERRRLKKILQQSGSSIVGSAMNSRLQQSSVETIVGQDTPASRRDDKPNDLGLQSTDQ